MATSSDMSDKKLCSLCKKELTEDIRALPCGDAFCSSCLSGSDTSSSSTSSSESTLLCPCCKKIINEPKPEERQANDEQVRTELSEIKDSLEISSSESEDQLNKTEQLQTTSNDDEGQSSEEFAQGETDDGERNRQILANLCDELRVSTRILEQNMETKIQQLRQTLDNSAVETAAEVHRRAEELIAEFTASVLAQQEETIRLLEDGYLQD